MSNFLFCVITGQCDSVIICPPFQGNQVLHCFLPEHQQSRVLLSLKRCLDRPLRRLSLLWSLEWPALRLRNARGAALRGNVAGTGTGVLARGSCCGERGPCRANDSICLHLNLRVIVLWEQLYRVIPGGGERGDGQKRTNQTLALKAGLLHFSCFHYHHRRDSGEGDFVGCDLKPLGEIPLYLDTLVLWFIHHSNHVFTLCSRSPITSDGLGTKNGPGIFTHQQPTGGAHDFSRT